jgi:hypothetical protein
MSKNSRYVVNHPQGWAVKAPHATRASSVSTRQSDAESRARNIVTNLGGGEVVTQNRQGKWRDSDTVGGGSDPFPPKDRK